MNKLQLLESLKEHHINLSSRQCDIYIERAANKIAIDTGVVKKSYLLDSVAGQRWYALDSKVLKVERVDFNDVKIPKLIGEPIIEDDEITDPDDTADSALSTPTSNSSNKRFWMLNSYPLSPYSTTTYDISGNTESTSTSSSTGNMLRIGIVEGGVNAITRDGRTSNYHSCSVTSTKGIRVYAISLPNAFNNSTNSSTDDSGSLIDDGTFSGPLADIPVEFHEVILNGAIMLGYQNPSNFNPDMIAYFKNEFIQGKKDIKKFERTRYSTGFIKPMDF